MKTSCLRLATALAVWGAACTATAQVSAPPPKLAASAGTPPGRQLMTPAQAREGASLPGEIRPERRVTPQISIPLGKPAPAPRSTPPRVGAKPGPAGGIDDAAARCEAQAGEQLRAECRDKLAHDARNR